LSANGDDCKNAARLARMRGITIGHRMNSSDEQKKIRSGLARYFNSTVAHNVALILFLALMLAGCTTVSYKSNSPVGVAKPANYPIPFYAPEMEIPRPCKVIGTLSINAGKFTMFGGSSEKEVEKVMQKAREKGADLVKLVSIDKPDFANPNYRMTVNLLRYSDTWETIAISKKEFQTYFDANRQKLDPIEGIWFSTGAISPHSLGIMRNKSKSGREFIGVILDTINPAWPPGAKKLDIRRGLAPGSYVITYYLDDFAPREIPIILGQKKAFAFGIQNADGEENVITYTKN
jgi:hypothetical protein